MASNLVGKKKYIQESWTNNLRRSMTTKHAESEEPNHVQNREHRQQTQVSPLKQTDL
jgi:hypothetical protein